MKNVSEQSQLDFDLYERFWDMFNRRLAEIPTLLIKGDSGWAEDVAGAYFTKLGYDVFHSRLKDGYRSLIDSSVHWHKLSAKDRSMVTLIKSSVPLDEYIQLIKAIRVKTGTPDLLLLKDGKLSFVEAKAKDELVKPCTIRFYLLYSHLWPISIARVSAQHPIDALASQFSS